MEFDIKLEPHCGTVTISQSRKALAESDIQGVFSPIRKAMLKYYGVTPTLITRAPRKDGAITIQLLGSTDVSDENIITAINGLKKYLRQYDEYHLSLVQFKSKIANDFGVGDIDITDIKADKAWFNRNRYIPRFAVAASQN